MKNPVVTTMPLAALLMLCACGGAPKKVDSLETARAAYSEASANEVVVKHAPKELDDARDALSQGERVWNKDGKRKHADHYAYIASQKVKIATLIAQRKEDDARLENMKLERQRVQLDVRSQEVDRARADTLAMQAQLDAMQARVTARGIVATLGDVLFDSGEAGLKPTSAVNMDKIASFMSSYPDRNAIVEGHTDNMGDDDYNLDLSRERAASVRSALIVRGIDSTRITTRSLGEASPIADNNSASGRQQNRRVEVIFPDDDSQISGLADQ